MFSYKKWVFALKINQIAFKENINCGTIHAAIWIF